MLIYDHSKQILQGLLGRHFLYDVNNTEPLKDTEGNYKYGKTTIDFPQPQYGDRDVVSFNVSESAPYPYRVTIPLFTSKQRPLKNRETYVVYWGDFPFVCTSHLSRTNQMNDRRTDDDTIKNYYLGNPNIMKVEGANTTGLPDPIDDISIEDSDENVPFFIWINGKKQEMTIYKKEWDPKEIDFGFYKRPEPEIFIGLFTQSPDSNGEGGREPGREVPLYIEGTDEPLIDELTGLQKTSYELWPEYLRVKVNTSSRFDKNIPLLSQATLVDGHPQVENQDMILFPEAVGDWQQKSGWGTITHFGLFYGQKDNLEQQTPFLWGEITNEKGGLGVNIGFQEVPVIRKSGLKISLE